MRHPAAAAAWTRAVSGLRPRAACGLRPPPGRAHPAAPRWAPPPGSSCAPPPDGSGLLPRSPAHAAAAHPCRRRSPAPAAAAAHLPAPPDTARSGMHCSLPQPRNLGCLLHLRFRSPEAAGLRIRPLPHRIYASLGWICIDAVFFRLVVVPVFIALELGPYVGLGLARPSWSVGLGCSRCGDRR